MQIGYICQQFPTLTQTFTYRQVVELQRNGLEVMVFSAKPPDPRFKPEVGLPSVKHVIYLPPVASMQMLWAQMISFLRQPRVFTHLLWQLSTAPVDVNRRLHKLRPLVEFIRGVYIAHYVRIQNCSVGHFHAEFAGSDASMAWVASRLTGIPFSFTSHTSKYEPLLKQKVIDARFVIAISHYEKKRLIYRCGAEYADKIHVIHLGVSPELWKPMGANHVNPRPTIVSVGSLVEKKGHEYLIRAIARLVRQYFDLQCIIVGDGPKRPLLELLIKQLGLSNVVTLTGPLPNDKVKSLCQKADIFVLACITSPLEGTDGIPVSLMEAMALGKPCVSTFVAGIPELIQDGETGLLVPERDEKALADAIMRLLLDPGLRVRLGQAARKKIETDFNLSMNAKKLACLFKDSLMTLLGHGDCCLDSSTTDRDSLRE
jgi:glycosyltransferase involved in cell wall biosynthesis